MAAASCILHTVLLLLGRADSAKLNEGADSAKLGEGISCTFVFDDVFTQKFCCDPLYSGECVNMEDGCCSEFDDKSLRKFDHLQFATINPSGLVEWTKHLKATKAALPEVAHIFQLARVRATLAAMALHNKAPPGQYMEGLAKQLWEKFSVSAFQTGHGLHLPLRVGPGSPGMVWAKLGQPLQTLIHDKDLANEEDLKQIAGNASEAQYSFERMVLWDQWLRAAESWGDAPDVELYLKGCCTANSLVGQLLKFEAAVAVVGDDSTGVAKYVMSKGAHVFSAVTSDVYPGAQDLGAQPPPLAKPTFPKDGLVIPSLAVDDDSLDMIFISLETGFVAVWAALNEWLPKLRSGGFLVANHILTNPDAAAALYLYAAKHGYNLKLATNTCAFIVQDEGQWAGEWDRDL